MFCRARLQNDGIPSRAPIERIFMSNRLIDDLLRWLARALIGLVICFLVTPIVVTSLMAFDDRAYLGPLPPPALSFRWFAQFFSDNYFLRGLQTSVALAFLAVSISLATGIAAALAIDRGSFVGKELLMSL